MGTRPIRTFFPRYRCLSRTAREFPLPLGEREESADGPQAILGLHAHPPSHAIVLSPSLKEESMETVRIFPLHGLSRTDRQRLREAQQEAAKVWRYCVERHRTACQAHQPWPGRKELQEETKGGQFALHSQSVQMVAHQFFANVDTIAKLRQTNPQHRYPYHPKKYLTVEWPEQAVSRTGNTLLLPMGRGRTSLTFPLRGLPEQIGAVSLVWNGGYEVIIVVPLPSRPRHRFPTNRRKRRWTWGRSIWRQ